MIIINQVAALADILLKALNVTNRRSDQCVTYLLLLHVAYTHKSKLIHTISETANWRKSKTKSREKERKTRVTHEVVVEVVLVEICRKGKIGELKCACS